MRSKSPVRSHDGLEDTFESLSEHIYNLNNNKKMQQVEAALENFPSYANRNTDAVLLKPVMPLSFLFPCNHRPFFKCVKTDS